MEVRLEEILAYVMLYYPSYTMEAILNEPLVVIDYLFKMAKWKEDFEIYNQMFSLIATATPK